MKTARNILIVMAITLCGKISQAQSVKLSNTLLWKITGKGLSKPSYLFGTLHMICESDYILREKVTKALAATTQLVTEINMTDSTEKKLLLSSGKADVPLSKKLTPEKYKELADSLKSIYHLDVKNFESYTIETVGSFIALSVFPCQKLKAYEHELQLLAKAQNKTFLGLEKVTEQIEVLEKASGEAYVFNLLKTTKEFNEVYKNIIQWYKTEEVDTLYNASTSEVMMTEESKKWMLVNRNQNWAKKLPSIMKEKSSFIAVGAAHLSGKEGVINLLKKAGYTVTPIMN